MSSQPLETFHQIVLTDDQVNVVYEALALLVDEYQYSDGEGEVERAEVARQVQLGLDSMTSR